MNIYDKISIVVLLFLGCLYLVILSVAQTTQYTNLQSVQSDILTLQENDKRLDKNIRTCLCELSYKDECGEGRAGYSALLTSNR
jgi:hypothetical protein